MSYFSDTYPAFRYPLKSDDQPGLRPAQLGAIHAAAAHFVTRNDPGVITMPTGSGKTAVLIAAAFVLRAQRVLIIAPSRLVREQIAEEVSTLATLKRAGALAEDTSTPRVHTTKARITSAESWDALREFDVVVGTIQSISPEYDQVPEPPGDLFDLVLVDEAHHSPARTWSRVLNHFSDAKRLLFTATPFRQDQREIKGRFIFTYDLRDAYRDGVFGEIAYQPVTPEAGQNNDTAVAIAAERQFRADGIAGLQHRLMVRTDSLKRASELAAVYEANTQLRLSVVTGDKSLRHVKGIIAKLDAGELDGIICVNMLGEGFNLPSLKIAAIHSPHRSLSVTLQFIGRFARTAGANLGRATFIAVPSEIQIEAARLYDTQAVWQDLVENLSAARVQQEAQAREVFESFQPMDLVSEDLADMSLYVLHPYYHVKVFQLAEAIDIAETVTFPEAMQVVYKSVSEPHNAAVYITREISLPRWTTDDRLQVVQPELFIFYQDPETQLLFICASRRVEGLYAQLVAAFADAQPRPLPLVRLNRALNELTEPEFFSVGMRNRVASNTTESYRMIAGSNAAGAVLKSDARLYHRGHVFGRAQDGAAKVTIGLSSASKVWSNRSSRLPELIEWCETLARRIASGENPVTHSGLDFLDPGEELNALPPNIIDVLWSSNVYRNTPYVLFTNPQGARQKESLLDCDLFIDSAGSDASKVVVELSHPAGLSFRFGFSFETDRYFEAEPGTVEPGVEFDRDEVSFLSYVNDDPVLFYTDTLALIDGGSIMKRPAEDMPIYDDSMIETWNWAADAVDIRREFGQARAGMISIHEHLQRKLAAGNDEIVYYDHGTGEVADFIAFERIDDRLRVRLYHCKGATGDDAGHRLGDVYEISGQAVKSVTWALKSRLQANIRRRFTTRKGSHTFVKGNLQGFTELLDTFAPAALDFEFIAVQPGLAKAGLPAELSNLLAAASDHLTRGGFKPLRVIASI